MARRKAARASKSAKGAIDPAAVAAALSKYAPADAIISVDVGNVAYSFGRYFEAKEQSFIGSWYLGSIGFGLRAQSARGAPRRSLTDNSSGVRSWRS